jgi:hypothetical protein
MKILFHLIFILIFISCNKKQEKLSDDVDSLKKPGVFFSGKPELPRNNFEITSVGLGKYILGTPFNSIANNKDSTSSITVYKMGTEWPAKKINLSSKEWIMVESTNSVNQITEIHTNSTACKTSKNYFVGMPLDSINFNKDSVFIDPINNSFFLYDSGIWFKMDPVSENKFFKSKEKNIRNWGKATIHEFFIICGDC